MCPRHSPIAFLYIAHTSGYWIGKTTNLRDGYNQVRISVGEDMKDMTAQRKEKKKRKRGAEERETKSMGFVAEEGTLPSPREPTQRMRNVDDTYRSGLARRSGSSSISSAERVTSPGPDSSDALAAILNFSSEASFCDLTVLGAVASMMMGWEW